MKVFITSDHNGLPLAKSLARKLEEQGKTVIHAGEDQHNEQDDYVDFGAEMGRLVSQDIADGNVSTKGIAICGSGVGMDIAVNKIKGIRSGLGFSKEQVASARNDDDINVLSLGSDFLTEEKALELVNAFLETPFGAEERFSRRINKVHALEDTK